MKACKCPVCSGTGKYNASTCHGCAGLGWIAVAEDSPPPVPQPLPQPWEPGFNPLYPARPDRWAECSKIRTEASVLCDALQQKELPQPVSALHLERWSESNSRVNDAR